ncbi:MAG: type II toxin-antitoxin system RelE/ParE family toxin [Planctomycetes bacterium]|nr:type II toxin-antitoxin system RelE/ParE family toxin [Planctomycetota bacterium]
MTSKSIEFHPSAIEEAREARLWYFARSERAATQFMRSLDEAIFRLAESPSRFPVYKLGTRRVLLRGFPFILYYREVGETIQVVAVAHAKRRPGYWQSRTL